MIKAGIIGATGYAGIELVRILTQHPKVSLVHLGSRTYDGTPYVDTVSSFRHELDGVICSDASLEELTATCDVVFLALPHGIASQQVNGKILEKTCIIDLGADFRLKDVSQYEKWYGVDHHSPQLLGRAVYGLAELEREAIASSDLIANPGCYTTCSILTLAPLVNAGLIPIGREAGLPVPIYIDAKSGVSGAGRKTVQGLHFCEAGESIKAYKVGSHRHTPEIEEYLKTMSGSPLIVQFTPHLVPMNRGILITAYIPLGTGFTGTSGKGSDAMDTDDLTTVKLLDLYSEFYKGEHFIRILPEGVFPETRWVKGSNFTDIGAAYDERTRTIIAVGAIDNLFKGAAGQAVQNMNIRFGFDEADGIGGMPLFP